jgi:two-component sensor histidine kinase
MALVKQLHGTIELERKEGTAFIIRFEEKQGEGRKQQVEGF